MRKHLRVAVMTSVAEIVADPKVVLHFRPHLLAVSLVEKVVHLADLLKKV